MKREDRMAAYCGLARCEFCRIEFEMVKKGLRVKNFTFEYTQYRNVVLVKPVTEPEPYGGGYYIVPAERFAIAHFYGWETYGLTVLVRIHKITALDQIMQLTREGLDCLAEVGPKTLAKIDNLLNMAGWWYKESAQQKLYYDGFPFHRIS